MMDPVSMIQIKRTNERPHTPEEIQWWIEEYTLGRIPDYQMSAWLMAVCWRGMNDDETAILTKCMVESGVQIQWETDNNNDNVVLSADKHSTGGVGDKISILLAPLAACLDVQVPMMAGRGLGHTGGTIDKLESIPGYRTSLDVDQFQSIVASGVGCSIVSPNSSLCPADRKLYGLRDVTATVSCIPLQTASIMSKKIAEHPQHLVLDVKYGVAAFQQSVDEATVLANSMIATGQANGVETTAFLTRMDSPIGCGVGNWLEIYECIQIMKKGIHNNNNSIDLIILVVVQVAQMVKPKYPNLSWEQLVEKVLTMLQSGQVYTKFRQMVQAHGGDVSLIDDCPINEAKFTKDIIASPTPLSVVKGEEDPGRGGGGGPYVSKINALVIGQACVKLGAGRTKAEDSVDPHAGIWFHVGVGDVVEPGKTKIATLYTNLSETILEQTYQWILQQEGIQYSFSDDGDASSNNKRIPPIISHRVTKGGHVEEFEIPAVLKDLSSS